MLEMPEIAAIGKQADRELRGKTIVEAGLGNTPHKFLFLDCEQGVDRALHGRTIQEARSHAKWLHLPLDDGATLSFYELGGLLRYHPDDSALPKKHHVMVRFDDGSCLTLVIQMWGCLRVGDSAGLARHPYAPQEPDALSKDFDVDALWALLRDVPEGSKATVKKALVSAKSGLGIGNGYLQDVLYEAGLLPMRKVSDLAADDAQRLWKAIKSVIAEAVDLGGRDVERDLYGHPGGYRPLLDKRMNGEPCRRCGNPITKLAYLGGSCYFCSQCQT